MGLLQTVLGCLSKCWGLICVNVCQCAYVLHKKCEVVRQGAFFPLCPLCSLLTVVLVLSERPSVPRLLLAWAVLLGSSEDPLYLPHVLLGLLLLLLDYDVF